MLKYADWFITIFNGMYGLQGTYEQFKKINDMISMMRVDPVFTTISAILTSIGLTLLVLYSLVDCAKRFRLREFTAKFLFLTMVRFLMAYVIATHVLDIVSILLEFGTALAADLTELNPSTGFFDDSENAMMFAAGVSSISTWDSICFFGKACIPYFFVFVSNLVVWFIGLCRAMELIVRCIFIPATIADISKSGSRSNGLKSLKKILALSLQFSLVIAICLGISLVLTTVVSEGDVKALTDLLEVSEYKHSVPPYFFQGIWFDPESRASAINIYSVESCKNFLNALLGGAEHYVFCLGIMAAKIGLLMKSQRFADEIAGVN